MGLENDAHKNERFNPGRQALSSGRGAALSPTLSCGPPAPGPGSPARRPGGGGLGSEASVSRRRSSAGRERARRSEGCRRAAYSAYLRRPIRPGGLPGGGASATSAGRSGVRSRPSGFLAAAAAPALTTSLVRNAAFGVGRPVGGRTASSREEGGAVGGHRAPRAQDSRHPGGLLQRLLRAGWRPERWASGSRAAFPASGASAGAPSRACSPEEGWEVGVASCLGSPGAPTAPHACRWL